MAIEVKCPECGTVTSVPDEDAGKTASCSCGSTLSIPPAAEAPAAIEAPAPPARRPGAGPRVLGIAAIIAALLAGGLFVMMRLEPDPVIGKWVDGKGVGIVEFKADKSVVYDLDVEKASASFLAANPRVPAAAIRPYLEKARDQLRQWKSSWSRTKDLYTVSPPAGQKDAQSFCAKVQDDKLMVCDKDGTPLATKLGPQAVSRTVFARKR